MNPSILHEIHPQEVAVEHSLFDGDKPAAVTPEEVERLMAPKTNEQKKEVSILSEWEERYLDKCKELKKIIDEADGSGDIHVIPADKANRLDSTGSNSERVQTMARAVGFYGDAVAERYDIDEYRVELTSTLLSIAIGSGEKNVAMDDGSVIITALSLKVMGETSAEVYDVAEQQSAEEALDLLQDVLTGRENLSIVKGGEYDTGEIALAAIASHHFSAAEQ